MSPRRTLREATAADAEQVAAIYAPIVRDTAISFELDPPDAGEMRRRIVATLERCPWLVCAQGERVLGYAYAGPHRARAAYGWSVDVSVYIHESARGKGVGTALYTALLELLVLQGFHRVYAGITLPNAASVGLHESVGFRPVGTYERVGFKHGAWHDVGWWQRSLQPPAPPSATVDFPVLARDQAYRAAFATAAALLGAGD